jgi:hypothetical protein
MSTTDATKSLRDEFMKVVETGNEQAAKDFIIDHLKEFPEEVQTKIISAFFFDALDKEADGIEKRAALQKEALSVFADIEKAEKTLGDEKKKMELRTGLGI